MRSEDEMYELILATAEEDARVRGVILNGSRADPTARRDIFQDFDVVYLVSDVRPFRDDATWIDRFGERIILQTPEAMPSFAPVDDGRFVYLLQLADGNRIDLTLYPVGSMGSVPRDHPSVVLLDKDGALQATPPSADGHPDSRPPDAQAFADACNEFWWVATDIAKGLWREEIVYAKHLLDCVARAQLTRMLAWHVGVEAGFSRNLGKYGRHAERHLEPEAWALLRRTYCRADCGDAWEALFSMCDLFRATATSVADRLGFDYPHGDDRRVSTHLRHVWRLPKNAPGIY